MQAPIEYLEFLIESIQKHFPWTAPVQYLQCLYSTSNRLGLSVFFFQVCSRHFHRVSACLFVAILAVCRGPSLRYPYVGSPTFHLWVCANIMSVLTYGLERVVKFQLR